MAAGVGDGPPCVLHLLDVASGGWSAARSLLALLEHGRPEAASHLVLLIGGTGDERTSLGWGLRPHGRVAAPGGACERAWAGIRQVVRAWAPIDAICAWSEAALDAADRAAGHVPRVLVLTGPGRTPRRWERLPWLGGGLSRAGALVASGPGVLEHAVRRGLAPRHRSVWAPAPIEPSLLAWDRRAGTRARWGVNSQTAVLAALGEPESAVDARRAAYQAGVAAVAGCRQAILVPRAAGQLERALRFTERHRGHWRLIIEDRPLWELLPSCDGALWVGPEHAGAGSISAAPVAGTTGLAWASACGLPILAEDAPGAREALDGVPRARLVAQGDRMAFSRSMIEMQRERPAPAPDQRVLAAHEPSIWARAVDDAIALVCGTGGAASPAHAIAGATSAPAPSL